MCTYLMAFSHFSSVFKNPRKREKKGEKTTSFLKDNIILDI